MLEGPDHFLVTILDEIKTIARTAGEAVMHFYHAQNDHPEFVQFKQDASPVTEADIISNEIILGGLNALPEKYPVISEESAIMDWQNRQKYRRFWIVDPLDGTAEFINKNNEFAIHIGLSDFGKPVLGVVYMPATQVMYYAVKRMGAFKQNGNQIDQLFAKALDMHATGIRLVHSRSHMNARTETYINTLKQPIKTPMGSSLKMMSIAEGIADLYPGFSGGIKEWDTCAPQIILEEAGGIVVCLEKGKPLEYNKKSLLQPDFLAMGKLIAYYDF